MLALALTTLRGQDLGALAGRAAGGEAARAPRYPSARVLVDARALAESRDPDPAERMRLVRGGLDGVGVIEALEGDVILEDAIALVALPGRAPGQRTVFYRTELGLTAWSSNGVVRDAWDPQASRLPGIAARARAEDLEVIASGDATSRRDQELAMAAERALADWDPARPDLHVIGTPLAWSPALFAR